MIGKKSNHIYYLLHIAFILIATFVGVRYYMNCEEHIEQGWTETSGLDSTKPSRNTSIGMIILNRLSFGGCGHYKSFLDQSDLINIKAR